MSRRWTLDDARELYNIRGWGLDLFDVLEPGHMAMTAGSQPLDLRALVDDLVEREIEPPFLIRFTDVLRARVNALCSTFQATIAEHEYKGLYRGVYPIKCNQQRQVVEEVVEAGRPYHLGLECGSKPELMIVMAEMTDPEALIICNGYKDAEYIEMALIAQKLGVRCVLVVEQPSELDTILQVSDAIGIEPMLGVRVRLAAQGTGRWKSSSGDRAKFGLSAAEIIEVVDVLKAREGLSWLKLLHYHIGSQISAVRRIQDAVREASRFYVELKRFGAEMGFLDVGGGLGIDYDGSRTDFDSSMNYDLAEYAETIVTTIAEVCDESEIAHPNIVTETGRALVAHSSLLVVPVMEASRPAGKVDAKLIEKYPSVAELNELHDELSARRPQRVNHRLADIRERMLNRFEMGLAGLEERAAVETMARDLARKLYRLVIRHGALPEDVEDLEKAELDIYYCNFSVFQSMPDSWAIDQVFPVVPLQRLGERPTRRGTLADVTCDSDGRLDRFVDVRDVKRSLELHKLDGTPYYLGIFLLGAYQEILG
ncbi:MAG: biosynthetic arginine decarboxylase, partial [Myxococcales bacterium]|nr:biosynthetic arginine decarboxylase [Myxococcales bacterium]